MLLWEHDPFNRPGRLRAMIVAPEAVAAVLQRAASEVILPRYRKLSDDDVREKGPGDLVTVADTEAERLLGQALRALAPGSVVVGEEAVAADPRVLGRLAGTKLVWIIDPVDGTHNFAHGRPDFAVIVALVQQGQVCAGWIHDPLAGATIWAVAGGGTWQDGRRVSLPAAPPLAAMTGMVTGTLSGAVRAKQVFSASGRVGPLLDPHCAGQTYARLVDGTYHYALFTRSRPWDHAAGWLIHREAGGVGGFLNGAPYDPARLDQPLLYAPDAASWAELRAIALGAA